MSTDTKLVHAARALQKLPLPAFRFVESPLVRMYRAGLKDICQPIILLALPRSGSTLTYQVLTHGIQSVYLNNLGNVLYQLPYWGGLVSMATCKNYQSDFQSDLGFVQGMCGPAEGLRYWEYWMGNGLDDRSNEQYDLKLINERMQYLKSVFSALMRDSRPVNTGYLGHALHVERLQLFFPNAVFIRLIRNPLDNALSILEARMREGAGWLSLFPRECEAYLGRGLHKEVAAQVYWLNKRLDEVTAKNVFNVEYASLCTDPRGVLDDIVSYCHSAGLNVRRKNDLPPRFEMRARVNDENSELIRGAFSELIMEKGR